LKIEETQLILNGFLNKCREGVGGIEIDQEESVDSGVRSEPEVDMSGSQSESEVIAQEGLKALVVEKGVKSNEEHGGKGLEI
jgi:hypothetical protein